MTLWLLQTFNDIDTDLVERAAEPPAVKERHPVRRTAVIAAALALAVGLGLWFGHGNGWSIPTEPITPSQTSPTHNDSTTESTTVPTTPDDGPGIGGDENECDIHSWEYHTFHNRLTDYVEDDRYQQYLKDYKMGQYEDKSKKFFYAPHTQCPYPESNIVDFVEYFGITRDEFIKALEWEDCLDRPFQYLYPIVEDGPEEDYTFGEFVDAVFGADPVLSEWVFSYRAKSLYDDYQFYYFRDLQMSRLNNDPLYDFIVSREEWDGYDPIAYFSYEDMDENTGLYAFLQYCGVTKEEFIDVYGWGDKLDQKATDHYKYAPYTYGQYVDALYGGDEALRSWLFNKNVFNPDYPTLEEYSKLSAGDEFYEPAPPIAEMKRVQLCHDHNPMYHRFDQFDLKDVIAFKRSCSGMDDEAFNVVNLIQNAKTVISHQYTNFSFARDYGFDLRKKTRNNIAADHGEGCPYTYWQFYLAVWGSDAKLTEWVFAPTSTWPKAEQWPPEGEWPPEGYGYEREVTCTVHKPVYHDLSYFPADKVEKYKKAVGYDNTEAHNVIDFINYYGIPHYAFPQYLGFDWKEDPAMERIAVELGSDVNYTYRQFVDAIYGDDPELTAKVFGTEIASVTTTTTRDPNWGRDENGNTTTRGSTTTRATQP